MNLQPRHCSQWSDGTGKLRQEDHSLHRYDRWSPSIAVAWLKGAPRLLGRDPGMVLGKRSAWRVIL